jgi:hydrogenase maturation factor
VASRGSGLPNGKLDPELLERLLGPSVLDASVRVGPGPGRDVAVVDAGGPNLLLLTADPVTFATTAIGHYAVTVNVNDVATAGGRPRWLLATVLVPTGSEPELVFEIQEQLREACAGQGLCLVGGHTEVTDAVERPVVSGALVGEVARDALVSADGTRPGDVVLLTQSAALEGTAILASELEDRLRAAGFTSAFLEGCARLRLEPGLSVLPAATAALAVARVHAMHDPTEGGVATALWELAEAARVDLEAEPARIPVLPETRQLCEHVGVDPLGLIASGALLLAVEAAHEQAVAAACAERGIPCTRIARALGRSGSAPRVLDTGSGGLLPRFAQDEITRAL